MLILVVWLYIVLTLNIFRQMQKVHFSPLTSNRLLTDIDIALR